MRPCATRISGLPCRGVDLNAGVLIIHNRQSPEAIPWPGTWRARDPGSATAQFWDLDAVARVIGPCLHSHCG